MRFHHIGVACKNIPDEIAAIKQIHDVKAQTEIIFDEKQTAELALLTLADGTRIELISGRQVESLVKRHISYYHICFEVDDIDTEIQRLVRENSMLVSPPKPAMLFDNRLVAFLQVSYGLIELLNSK